MAATVDERIRNRGGRIVGVGSALTDILAHESDAFLASISEIKGGMTYVEPAFIDDCLKKLSSRPEIVPGGAACNTIQGVARLGGAARFVGKRGQDATGESFEKGVVEVGIAPELTVSETPSGRVLSIITPDSQRSMFTYLGASSELMPEEIPANAFADAAIVVVEGYLLFNPDLALGVIERAKAAGAVIAMDLASFTVVEAARDLLDRIVPESVDILIANEDEAKAFTGTADEAEGLERMQALSEVAVLKVGSRGSRIHRNGETVAVPAVTGEPIVDTTGAGDLWASGFLYGLVNGWDTNACGTLASACGYEVCRVIGAQIPDAGWDRIRSQFL